MGETASFLILLLATCFDGQIRLLEDYSSETSGQVRICSNQRWKVISGTNWRNDEARVVCNALGYSYSGILI